MPKTACTSRLTKSAFSLYFKNIAADTTEFQSAIEPLFTAEWNANAEQVIASIQSFAAKLSPDTYRACIQATKDYINGLDFNAPGRFETKWSILGSEIKYTGATAALTTLNQALDDLIVAAPTLTPTWREILNNAALSFLSTIKFVEDHPKSTVATLFYGQAILASAITSMRANRLSEAVQPIPQQQGKMTSDIQSLELMLQNSPQPYASILQPVKQINQELELPEPNRSFFSNTRFRSVINNLEVAQAGWFILNEIEGFQFELRDSDIYVRRIETPDIEIKIDIHICDILKRKLLIASGTAEEEKEEKIPVDEENQFVAYLNSKLPPSISHNFIKTAFSFPSIVISSTPCNIGDTTWYQSLCTIKETQEDKEKLFGAFVVQTKIKHFGNPSIIDKLRFSEPNIEIEMKRMYSAYQQGRKYEKVKDAFLYRRKEKDRIKKDLYPLFYSDSSHSTLNKSFSTVLDETLKLLISGKLTISPLSPEEQMYRSYITGGYNEQIGLLLSKDAKKFNVPSKNIVNQTGYLLLDYQKMFEGKEPLAKVRVTKSDPIYCIPSVEILNAYIEMIVTDHNQLDKCISDLAERKMYMGKLAGDCVLDGSMYQLQGGHTWAANLSWLLAHIHKGSTFFIRTNPSLEYLYREGRAPKDLGKDKEDKAELSGYAREIATLVRLGYLLQVTVGVDKGVEITLSPPTDLEKAALCQKLSFFNAYLNSDETIKYFSGFMDELQSLRSKGGFSFLEDQVISLFSSQKHIATIKEDIIQSTLIKPDIAAPIY